MTAGGGVHAVGEAEGPVEAGVVSGRFLSAEVDGVFFRAFADPLGGFLAAVGQDIAEAFAFHQLLGHGDDGAVVAPGHLEPVGVCFR